MDNGDKDFGFQRSLANSKTAQFVLAFIFAFGDKVNNERNIGGGVKYFNFTYFQIKKFSADATASLV